MEKAAKISFIFFLGKNGGTWREEEDNCFHRRDSKLFQLYQEIKLVKTGNNSLNSLKLVFHLNPKLNLYIQGNDIYNNSFIGYKIGGHRI